MRIASALPRGAAFTTPTSLLVGNKPSASYAATQPPPLSSPDRSGNSTGAIDRKRINLWRYRGDIRLVDRDPKTGDSRFRVGQLLDSAARYKKRKAGLRKGIQNDQPQGRRSTYERLSSQVLRASGSLLCGGTRRLVVFERMIGYRQPYSHNKAGERLGEMLLIRTPEP